MIKIILLQQSAYNLTKAVEPKIGKNTAVFAFCECLS